MVGEQAQDVALDAEIVGDDVQALAGATARALLERPVRALVPLVGAVGADDLGEVHALESRKALRGLDRQVGTRGGITARDAAGLRALLAQDAGELARVDLGDRDRVAAAQEVGQRLGCAPARMQQRQVADDEAGRVHEVRLVVVRVRAGVADVRVGQGDDLARIGRVGQDLLVSRHGGVEHHLARRRAGRADGNAPKHGAVLESQDSGCRHGYLRRSDQLLARATTAGVELALTPVKICLTG